MNLESDLQSLGGVTLSDTLLSRGHSPHFHRQAVATGRIFRPRWGWVSLPNADPQLVFAATHRVILTCISQAARLGLWVLSHNQMHVARPLTARKTTPHSCKVHWQQPVVPRNTNQLTDNIENMLDTVGACQPHDAALIQREYAVIRVNYAQVVYDWAEVEARVLGAVARGLHLAAR